MKQTTSMMKMVLTAGFIVYLYVLIKLILFKGATVDVHFIPEQLNGTFQHPNYIFERSSNYIPFKQILSDIHSMSISNVLLSNNLIGNILAFIPLGIFIPKLFTTMSTSLVSVFILSLSLSLCFEVTQLLMFIGIPDVDDLILNTFGGIIGYVCLRCYMIINSNLLARNRQVNQP